MRLTFIGLGFPTSSDAILCFRTHCSLLAYFGCQLSFESPTALRTYSGLRNLPFTAYSFRKALLFIRHWCVLYIRRTQGRLNLFVSVKLSSRSTKRDK
jgi:hypothetical protein